jgi:hypothetical protein
MDTSILYVLMLVVGVLMFMLPFFIFIVMGNSLGIPTGDFRLTTTMLLGGSLVMFLISFMIFMLLQRFSCKGKSKSAKTIAENAGISTGIYAGFVILATLIPALRGVVINVLSPEVEQNVRDSLAYGYYGLWGAMFGVSVGGTLSSICA